MGNRVKEQMQLLADRASAHCQWANQWRLLLSAMAYTLIEPLTRLTLAGSELAQATAETRWCPSRGLLPNPEVTGDDPHQAGRRRALSPRPAQKQPHESKSIPPK